MTDLSGFEPNVEAIVGYEPDLSSWPAIATAIVGALETVGIPTLLLERPTAVDDTYDQIGELGTATGHADGGCRPRRRHARPRSTSWRQTSRNARQPLRYYYELSDDAHSATSETFIGSVLALAGLESIADGVDGAAGGFPQLVGRVRHRQPTRT